MAVAVYMHLVVMEDPFLNMTGGRSYEPALVSFGIAVLFLASGPGRFFLDRLFSKQGLNKEARKYRCLF